MKLYVQLTIIFTISLIGEIISDGLHLPIPWKYDRAVDPIFIIAV